MFVNYSIGAFDATPSVIVKAVMLVMFDPFSYVRSVVIIVKNALLNGPLGV